MSEGAKSKPLSCERLLELYGRPELAYLLNKELTIKADMLKALEAAEWGGSIDGWSCCSVCGGVKGDAFDDGSRYGAHAPDCILAAAIKKARGEDT